MKKFLTALLWIGLAASLTMLFSVMNQKNALVQAEDSAARKCETIQARYEETKTQLDEAIGAKKVLAEDRETLTKEKAALEAQLREAAAALKAAQLEAESLAQAEREARQALETASQAWEEQRQALTVENATDSQAAEALAVLPADAEATDTITSPETDQPDDAPETEESQPATSVNALEKHPAKDSEDDSIFQLSNLREETVTELK